MNFLLKTMDEIIYSANDEWGMTYLFKKGYKRITSNMDRIETTDDASKDWIARYYYTDKKGHAFLKYKGGRKLNIEINPRINFFSEDYMRAIQKEIDGMNEAKAELKKVYSELEKKVYGPHFNNC
jgi:hypothetical protein